MKNICHAMKIIIRLTETLGTKLLIPYNSIYIKLHNYKTLSISKNDNKQAKNGKILHKLKILFDLKLNFNVGSIL